MKCSGFYVKEGVGYLEGNAIEGLNQVTAIAGSTNYYPTRGYLATADGLLWKYGDTLTLVPMFVTEGDALNLESTNLVDNVLTEDSLVLDFTKFLSGASPILYADSTQVTVTPVIENDRLFISRSKGFEPGIHYTLKIPVANISSTADNAMAEDLIIEFTYDPNSGKETPFVEKILTDATHETRRGVFALLSDGRLYAFESLWNDCTSPSLLLENVVSFDMENINTAKMGTVFALLEDGTIIGFGGELPEPMIIDQFAGLDAVDISFSYGRNYWGTTNETAIGLQLIDYTDFTNYGRLMYAPYLTEAPEDTFPFVTAVTILNKAGEEVFTVGNEEITVRITFNRDMDTTIPLMVRFGSAYPYGDYEISGSFVDARTWEGVYTLNTIIENGYHFFSIGNGRTADKELELFTD